MSTKRNATLYWWSDVQLERAGWAPKVYNYGTQTSFRVWIYGSKRVLEEERDGERGAWREEPLPPTRLTAEVVTYRTQSVRDALNPAFAHRRWAARVLRTVREYALKTRQSGEIRENMDRIHEAFWTEPEDD